MRKKKRSPGGRLLVPMSMSPSAFREQIVVLEGPSEDDH